MPIGEICSREVVCAKRDATVKTAARLMRDYHVGNVVVVDEAEGKRISTGILTDRDVTVAVVALASMVGGERKREAVLRKAVA